MSNIFAPPLRLTDIEHGVVHRDEAAFCGWPFLGGFWTTGNGDMLVAFQKKPANYADPSEVNHDEVARVGPRIMTIRSRDHGASWDQASLSLLYDLGADQADPDRAIADTDPGPAIDFTDPDTLVASGATPDYFRPASRAWLRVSTDGGQNWRPPVLMRANGPALGLGQRLGAGAPRRRGAAIRHRGHRRRLEAPPGGVPRHRGRAALGLHVLHHPRAVDDGAGHADRSLPIRFSPHRYFYPRAIWLPSGRILCSLRGQRDPTSVFWTEIFASDDGGRSWQFLSRVNDWGAPGDLVRMNDGRIACVYGSPDAALRYPRPPQRATKAGAGARELILRDDGGSWDLGYPRVTEGAPGELLTVYYFNRADDPVQQNGGVRHIAFSRFRPD